VGIGVGEGLGVGIGVGVGMAVSVGTGVGAGVVGMETIVAAMPASTVALMSGISAGVGVGSI